MSSILHAMLEMHVTLSSTTATPQSVNMSSKARVVDFVQTAGVAFAQIWSVDYTVEPM